MSRGFRERIKAFMSLWTSRCMCSLTKSTGTAAFCIRVQQSLRIVAFEWMIILHELFLNITVIG